MKKSILIIVIVLVLPLLLILGSMEALFYFGQVAPERYLPERCPGPAGMDCLDKPIIKTNTLLPLYHT